MKEKNQNVTAMAGWIEEQEKKMLANWRKEEARLVKEWYSNNSYYQEEVSQKSAAKDYIQKITFNGIGSFRMCYQKVCIIALEHIQRTLFSCYLKSTDMLQSMKEKHVRTKIGSGISSSKTI